jgi:isopentenyl-diphosphate Delta-isomerase
MNNPNELFDVINKDDKVIGKATRSICHKYSLLHRSSKVLTFKDKSFQEVLLQKKSGESELNPHKICLPGGHVDSDESYDKAMKREDIEEMYDFKNPNKKLEFEKLFKIETSSKKDKRYTMVYRDIDPGPFEVDSHEVESYTFVKINKVLKDIKDNPRKYTISCRLILEAYAKKFL